MTLMFIISYASLIVLAVVSTVISRRVASKLGNIGVNTMGNPISAFIKGWQHADELDIKRQMIVWTVIVGGIVVFLIVFLITDLPRPSV